MRVIVTNHRLSCWQCTNECKQDTFPHLKHSLCDILDIDILGFTEGGHREGLYGPDFLLAEDNIVVAIQYRLGLFGFLNLGYGNYSGNMGLKDQQMALKYIYENIEEFSGNKSEILLFGESAGECSIRDDLKTKSHFRRRRSSLPLNRTSDS